MLTIGFGQPGYSMSEDDGLGTGSSLEICLSISGGSVERTVVVSVADEDGTAIGRQIGYTTDLSSFDQICDLTAICPYLQVVWTMISLRQLS